MGVFLLKIGWVIYNPQIYGIINDGYFKEHFMHLDCQSDHACPNPNQYDTASCGICDELMDVERNRLGKRNFASNPELHDYFHCSKRNEDWHLQAKLIKQQARKTASKIQKDALESEAADILINKKATVDADVLNRIELGLV
jgi:hypothetical protein